MTMKVEKVEKPVKKEIKPGCFDMYQEGCNSTINKYDQWLQYVLENELNRDVIYEIISDYFDFGEQQEDCVEEIHKKLKQVLIGGSDE